MTLLILADPLSSKSNGLTWPLLQLCGIVSEYVVLGWMFSLQPSWHQLHPHSYSNKLPANIRTIPPSRQKTHGQTWTTQLTESHGMWTAYYDVACSVPRQQRHSHLNDMMWRDIKRAQITISQEASQRDVWGQQEDQWINSPSWVKGKSITWNVTVRDK